MFKIKQTIFRLRYLMVPFFWFFSYIIPKDKHLYIYGSLEQTHYQGNPKYLHQYGSKNVFGKHVFFTKKKEIATEINHRGLQVEIKSYKKIYLLLRAKYIFIESTSIDISPYYILFGRFQIINLWHGGSALKKIEVDSKKIDKFPFTITGVNNGKYFKIIATSDDSVQYLQSAFNNRNVIVTGYPRNDILFKNTDYILPSYINNLKRYNKVITYAPTFRDRTEFRPFSEKSLQQIDEYCHKHNYIFVIKEHPLKQSINIKGKMNILQMSGIVEDVQELLSITDILITDYSSIMFDFALTGKPIIFFDFDLDEYLNNNRELYIEYEKDLPGPFVHSEEELLDCLKKSEDLMLDEKYLEKYNTWVDLTNKFKDGNSSKRVFEALLN